MKTPRSILSLATLLVLSGCAGGWREGAGPGAGVTSSAGGAASAASTASATGTHVAADGVVFVWKGGGESAAVAGEFNAWNTSADAMTKQADGSFRLVKKLEPGRYAYKFVVDGSNWKEDPTAKETVDDGYGGKNAIVTVGAGGAAAAQPAAPAPAATTANVAGGTTFKWTGGGNTVHVAGEFNAWNTSADAMTKQADGSFVLVKKLEPGRYAYKFVVDGSNWKEDPNAKETVDDGYGGKNAIVVVGGGGGAASPAAPAAAAPAAGSGKAQPPQVTADGVRFSYGGGARTVHLAGDFNGWSTTTDPLVRGADGTWTVTKKLPAGTHNYKFVIDGTTWKHDEANPQTGDDGYGGKNSVVTVP